MQLIATNLDLPFNADEAALPLLLSSHIRIPAAEIQDLRIVRHSLDARDKADIRSIYSVLFELSPENTKRIAELGLKNVGRAPVHESAQPVFGEQAQPAPVVVVGLGPAGLFAAHELAKYGYKVIVIERGKPISERKKDVETFFSTAVLDTNSNIMFGEGGAGTFSDGKLTTRIKDPRAKDVLDTLIGFGADRNIAIEAKPHIGTDVLSEVVLRMRGSLEEAGVEIRFNTTLTGLESKDGTITAVSVNGGERIECCACVLAIGQAARDTYRMLAASGLELSPKPFAVGVRIEHPQDMIDRSQYGKFAGHPRLGAAEYRLTGKSGNRGVYTFCMCPGGVVVASSSDKDQVVTNGMSYHARNGKNANSAIIVQVNPADFGADPLGGMIFQEKIENAAFRLGGGDYTAPAVRVGDFLAGRKPSGFGGVQPTYRPGVAAKDISRCLPPTIVNGIRDGIHAFARQIRNFDMYDAVLTAVESRSSAPVRIMRGELGEATRMKGLYPVGEGAGYAGGIVSAAVDGMRAAERIMGRYKPGK
ncbi:MAG: NAD(P)/FAD-dependent oxidoreductase [Clostridia bacterium]|nr:NAD(P)/FAD-dependent oxidoreductase [Clostridia bacterium]